MVIPHQYGVIKVINNPSHPFECSQFTGPTTFIFSGSINVNNAEMAKFFEKTQNIIIVSASGGGVLLISIIVLLLALKLARDKRRPQRQSDNVSGRNNEGYDGVYQYVEGEEMTETQPNMDDNGRLGGQQSRVSGENG